MNFLQWALAQIRWNRLFRTSEFTLPVAEQLAFLNALPEPEDDLARSYNQYRCQMRLSSGTMRLICQLAALVLLPIYRLRLMHAPSPRAEAPRDAVFLFDGGDSILPDTLRAEFPALCQVREYQYGSLLKKEDMALLSTLRRRYPMAFYFRFKCMLKLAMYRYQYEVYHPKAMIVSEEYSYTSSFLNEYCRRLGVEHINVMHGDKSLMIRDSFFHFDRCYIWNDHFAKLFLQLRAEPTQFRIELPPSMRPWDAQGVEKTVDYTYYLQKETPQMLEKITESLQTLRKRGAVVAVRPHPVYSDMDAVRRLFSDFEIEEKNTVSVETSILRTRHVISRHSTVLFQAHINHVPIVIDDITDPRQHQQLRDLKFWGFSLPHTLLSEELCRVSQPQPQNPSADLTGISVLPKE